MIKKPFATFLALFFSFHFAIAGDKNDPVTVDECIYGKWIITKTKFQWNVSMHNITKVKQSNDQRKKAAELLKDGIITFTDKSIVYFTPVGDTTVYTGRLTNTDYSGWSNGSYGSKGGELVIKFPGKGAKYNFTMSYSCPGKKKPNEFDGRSYDGYASFHFTRAEQ